MDPSLRSTPALTARIERARDELIKRFENLIGLAGIDKTERNTTATTEFQMQVETNALIRAAEDVQSLIRQMQEAWLFGQLNTIDGHQIQHETDENARAVAALLKLLAEQQGDGPTAPRLG